MSFLLPPTIALSSTWFFSFNNSYLIYKNDSDSEKHGFLRVNGSNVFSPLAKFEVVTANTGTGLVHIRCSQNRKFLRRRFESDVHVTPEADEPEEDQSKWSCTLFEPQVAEDGKPDRARLFHVQSKQYVTAWDLGGDRTGVRVLRLYDNPHLQGAFDIIDLESLVILPKHVAFKGDNRKYLMVEATTTSNSTFSSTDKGRPESWFEVSTDGHGRVQIKSFDTNRYLRNVAGWILADSAGNATDLTTLFWPVKVDTSTVALKSLSNEKFCSRFTDDVTSGLNARLTNITVNSRMALEELVLSRRIYNTDFDLKNAIIYGKTPVTIATVNGSNNTSEDNDMEFKFAYSDSKSSTWTASHSCMVGIEVSSSLKIPFIAAGEVTLKGEYSGSYEWGETVTSSITLETTYKVKVPKNTSVSVSLIATQGTCNVPFSYYQKDVLYNGKTVVYKKEDGLYKGVNSYNFRYEATTLKEPSARTRRESLSVADLRDPLVDPTTEQMLPDPSVDPTIEQLIPMPVPPGSTT